MKVDNFFNSLPESIKVAVQNSPTIVGIGPSAWPRVVSAYYFPEMKIISYNDTFDNDIIEKQLGIEIFSLKKNDPNIEISPETPGSIVDTQIVKNYLGTLGKDFIFLVYKSSKKLEKVCEENGWRFIGNTKKLSQKYENKKKFKEILKEVGIEPIPGENILIETLTKEKLLSYQNQFGTEKIVLQLAEVTSGGGSGTLFIEDEDGLKLFHKRVIDLQSQLKKKKLKTVNVAPYINGISSSISCCATHKGILTGPIQTQIIDIPEVGTKIPGRSGNYAGADWSFKHYSEDSQKQASAIAEKFGNYMYKEGYKGIFGIDLLVEENGRVWPVECNPRDTDAFPMVTMFMMQQGSIPLDVFHNLEHIGVEYDFDFEEINNSYKKEYSGSQIILHNREDYTLISTKTPLAGVYQIEDGNLVHKKEGFAIWDLENENEFLLTENIQKQPNKSFEPHGRIARLISNKSILEDVSKLNRNTKDLVDLFYKEFGLIKVEGGIVDDYGIKSLFVNKSLNANLFEGYDGADIVNAYAQSKEGFRRPYKIAWRLKLTSDNPLFNISSETTRKNIKYDLEKISGEGITIEKAERINNSTYLEWLELYKKIIGNKEKGNFVVDKDWYEEKIKKGKKVSAIFAYKDGIMIGGNLLIDMGKYLMIGYGVAERSLNLRGGLGVLLDYYSIEYAISKGYKEISFGKDDNLYGAHLSIGLLQYKIKLGLTPQTPTKSYSVSTFFKNFDKLSDNVTFFVDNGKGGLKQVVIYKSIKPEISKPSGIEEIEYFEANQITKKHNEILSNKEE